MDKVSIFSKNDIIIVIVLLLLAVAGLFAFKLFNSGEGRAVRVTVDGELFGEYELDNVRKEIEITGKIGKCIMVIENGQAYMKEAECPNQICVHHEPVSYNGETVVCLPNRIIIEITGGDDRYE